MLSASGGLGLGLPLSARSAVSQPLPKLAQLHQSSTSKLQIGTRSVHPWGLPSKRHRVLRKSSAGAAAAVTGGGGDNIKGGNGDGGGGGGDGNSNGKGDGVDPALVALLAAVGKSASSLPADMSNALVTGKVGVELLQRYLDLQSKFFIGWLMNFPGFRERLMADPSFMVKLAIECGIGVCTKCTAEYTKRQGTFSQELDFVAANVMMAIIADFMLVWLPAPTLSFAAASSASKLNFLARMFAGCPDNAFQKVQPGMPAFTLLQRMGAPIRNGMKLACVGFGASMVGVCVTNALIALRQVLDPAFVPLNQSQDVLATSMAYGAYMATSSNIRYQLVAGVIEERGIETWFKGNYKLCAILSFIVRTGNTFLGSLLWVDFVRLLGMQKAGGGH